MHILISVLAVVAVLALFGFMFWSVVWRNDRKFRREDEAKEAAEQARSEQELHELTGLIDRAEAGDLAARSRACSMGYNGVTTRDAPPELAARRDTLIVADQYDAKREVIAGYVAARRGRVP